ncbi:heat-inducible transcription repressor HrcA [Alicyclobacillus hesperidum URH17-3-68]|nr:heat-inducible transcription repressor HrcA [Alicyclobacillus hesperidum URH17-3-68]
MQQPRIAHIELVDAQALAGFAVKYRLGSTPSGYIDTNGVRLK